MLNIRPGFTYKTRAGHEVEVLRTDLKSQMPVLGIITFSNINSQSVVQWQINGSYDYAYANGLSIRAYPNPLDLVEELPLLPSEPSEEL
jgi:hypothetical protein